MSTYSDTVLQDVPSLYWRLGASGGTDLSGNSRTGTATGGVTIGSGASLLVGDADASTDFDGSNDYITSTYSVFAGDRSFEFWASRDTSTTVDAFFGGDGNPAAMLRVSAVAAGDVTFAPDSNNTFSSWLAAWPGDLQPVHCVLTFDRTANQAILYINSASAGSRTNASAWAAGNFQVGARGASVTPFDGQIDEVAVYESILPTARIKHHYNVGKGLINPRRRTSPAQRAVVPTGGTF